MAPGPSSVDLSSPPADLDPLLDWFDGFCERLVLLEEYSLEEIRTALGAIRGPVMRHCGPASPLGAPGPRDGSGARERLRRLESEHERFHVSIDQLDWFYSVVAHENHGGHRQALGQYGRAFAESFRRHRADELSLARDGSDSVAGTAPRPAPAKGY